ncbi:MAG: UDP-glucose 4-epimerase, partial [Nitrospinota bacterium]
ADPSKAQTELNWTAVNTITDMCKDSWNWQSKNPNGFS